MLISLLIAYKILFVTDPTQLCGASVPLDGCNMPYSQAMYIKNEPSRPQDWIIYHEIGHILNTKAPLKLFNNNVETLAENFALWIYESKYPDMFLRSIKRRQSILKVCVTRSV